MWKKRASGFTMKTKPAGELKTYVSYSGILEGGGGYVCVCLREEVGWGCGARGVVAGVL